MKNTYFKAFTLVELIVVIAILLVLSTISFLAYQSFSKEARDSKRVSDTRNLLNKVSILEVKGTSLNDLVSSYENGENIKVNSLTFNAQSGKIGYQGKVNFDELNEVEENFQDPKAKVNYPFAVSKGTLERNGKTESYSFQQIAYVSERDGKTKLVGNYFKYQDGDSPSLFVSDGTTGENIPGDYYVDDDEDQIYDIGAKPTIGCKKQPNYINATFTIGIPTQTNQARQNTNSGNPCYYECINGYTGNNCSIPPEITPENACTSTGQIITTTNSKYKNTPETGGQECDTDDIIVCTGSGTGYQVAACNVGAMYAGAWNDCPTSNKTYSSDENCNPNRMGYHFQWGNNHGFSMMEEPNIISIEQVDASGYEPGNYYSGSTFVKIGLWDSSDNKDLWGGETAGSEAKQGPCGSGYHIPTFVEWQEVYTKIGTGTTLMTQLKLPFTGRRHDTNAYLYHQATLVITGPQLGTHFLLDIACISTQMA